MRRTVLVECLRFMVVGTVMFFSVPTLAMNTKFDYQQSPAFVTAPVRPLTLLILDNSGSMGWDAYQNGYNSSTTYYGYFKNNKRYYWSGNGYWYEHPSGNYSGNYLNWYYTSRIDVAKKVLTGGKIGYRNGVKCLIGHNYDGTVKLEPGDNPSGILQQNSSLAWGLAVYDDDSTGGYKDEGGEVKKYIGTPTSEIVKAVNDMDLALYTPLSETLYTALQYFRQDSTPYFRWLSHEESPTCNDPAPVGDGVYTADGAYTRSNEWDPFYENTEHSLMPCARASVILITDGDPTHDYSVPSPYRTAAPGSYSGNNNSTYLDDVAYWAHTHDLRTEPGMAGVQVMDFYGIFAFGGAAQTIKDAAIMGGFIDKNGDGRPNTPAEEAAAAPDAREWDFNGDGDPDNYATASDGSQLGVALQNMLGQVMQKVSSGSAASVISASRSGEGAIYQAVFYPKTPPDAANRTVTWVGDVHALWLDDYGNMREDCTVGDTGLTCSGADHVLDFKSDKVLRFYTDPSTGESRAALYEDSDGDGLVDVSTCSDDSYNNETDCVNNGGTWTVGADYLGEVAMRSIRHYLWSGAEWLANASYLQRSSYASNTAYRYIFTSLPDASGKPSPVPFTTLSLRSALSGSGEYRGYLNAASDTEADNIVNYIRGLDQAGYRSRQYDWGDGVKTHRLGDIIHSTPTVVGRPSENYDQLYGDNSYRLFRKQYRYRRTMIYAGGNDGMLHAFNGGYFDSTTNTYLKAPPVPPITGDPSTQAYATQYDLGAEMWAYVPRNLLPHLKWLTDPDYAHINYVDLKPYIFDAKIFKPDSVHPHGWGTVMVVGQRLGGGEIQVDTDGDGTLDTTLRSSYTILDITDPEKPPVVLGEFTDSSGDLGFTTSMPTVLPMLRCDRFVSPPATGACPDNLTTANTWPMDWYMAFGSGPHYSGNPAAALKGESDQLARLYVLALGGTADTGGLPYVSDSTGVLNPPSLVSGFPKTVVGSCSNPAYASSATCTAHGGTWDSFPNSFFSDFIAVDYGKRDYRVDALYFGSVSNTDRPGGTSFQGGMHRLVVAGDLDPSNWYLNTFYDAYQPVTAAANAVFDGQRYWLLFGTGRLFSAVIDKNDSSQQSYYGLMEGPLDSQGIPDMTTANAGDLVDVSSVWIEDQTGILSTALTSTGGGALTSSTLFELNNEIGNYDGWKIDFPDSGERNLGQAAIIGDIATFTSYIPAGDICSGGGWSKVWAVYYRTGTAYSRSVIGIKVRTDGKREVLRSVSIGAGMATTPNLHSGSGTGTTAMIQTSSGSIISIKQRNPGVVKSGIVSWREFGE